MSRPPIPPNARDIETLRAASKKCRACPLWTIGTQTVFGEGPEHAPLMLVGEQPGDQEDLSGEPFVGPAGRLLNDALSAAGIDRAAAYVTNAVKHFKWRRVGTRRLHEKPGPYEVAACRPWLLTELEMVKPQVLVLMGVTAVQSLLGSSVKVLANRGKLRRTQYCEQTLITVHPSSVLRAPDEKARKLAFMELVKDFRMVASLVDEAARHHPGSDEAGAPA